MRLTALVLCAAVSLAACNKGAAPDDVDAEALDAISLAVEEQMNEPAFAIQGLLRAASQQAQVGWDTLVINLGEEPEPVNWWLQRRGFLELSGAQFATRAAFTLTKPAQDMLASPDQAWFEAATTGEPVIDCKTAAAVAGNGCEVQIEITPALTPAGRAAVGTPIQPLRPMAVTGVVTLDDNGEWTVLGLSGETQSPAEIALAAILGDPGQRQAAARAADDAMRGRLSQLAGETEAPINLEAFTPPNYITPEPPVAPIAPPTGRPSTPFRPQG
jgi:hypothetical protein